MSHDKLLVHLLNQIKVGVTFMFRNTVTKINDDRSICSIYNEYLYNYCFSFSPVSNNLRGIYIVYIQFVVLVGDTFAPTHDRSPQQRRLTFCELVICKLAQDSGLEQCILQK